MSKKGIIYKRKECIGRRQLYRRINESVQNLLHEIKSETIHGNNHTLINKEFKNSSDSITELVEHANIQISNEHVFCSDGLMCSSTVDASDTSDTISTARNEYNLRKKLQKRAITTHVPHSILNQLLHILNQPHPELPLDTLLGTHTQVTTIKLQNGEYCHLGLVNALLSKHKYFSDSIFKISFKILNHNLL
ncbi:hypothetical protein RN001_001637 [Aquatica leii]|uniref:Uncharacterized protein n=1 Tax=Aquatica leii TaxID=1421715 RepID=A0AAN7PNU6_9COLE|nr:hypothetical protein RN001_001637 [Aquatica leii]